MAATAGGQRAGLGWVILLIALAVPGVLFYNWWSHLKAEQARAVAAKAAARVPDGGVFQTPPPGSPAARLVNPMTPVASTATAIPSAVQTASAAQTAQTQAAAPAASPAATPAAAPAPAAAAAGNAQTPDSAAPPSASTAAAVMAAIPLKRDPMLSPYDQIRLLEEEQKRRDAEEALRNAMKPAKSGPKKAVKKDPRKLVEVQGIISTPDGGYKAIVSNNVVGVGESVNGVKIVRITDTGVFFNYQGQKFTMGVSQD